MSDYILYKGESDDGVELCLWVYDDGAHMLAVRVPGETWGAPVELTAEPAEVTR